MGGKFLRGVLNGQTPLTLFPTGLRALGSPEGEGYHFEKPHHEVAVPPFFMSKYPVTQVQWRACMAVKFFHRDCLVTRDNTQLVFSVNA